MTVEASSERDPEAVLMFIERFATALTEAGFPRMSARVFVALFASDAVHMTASDLADQLQVSHAAISGAIRYLIQTQLVRRERRPGERQEFYLVDPGVWYEVVRRRDQELLRWEEHLREGVDALGPETSAGAKLAATLPFFEFMQKEFSAMLARWMEQQSAPG